MEHRIECFTATCLHGQPSLQPDEPKQRMMASLKFLIDEVNKKLENGR